MTIPYFAHSANRANKWHPLAEHLECVSQRAREFSGVQPWAAEAALAGLLHDLGKYADRFQARLKGQDSGLDHWSQGAWVALAEHRAIAAALAIQGHHVGLQNWNSLRLMNPQSLTQNHPFGLDLSDDDHLRLKQRAEADGLLFHAPAQTALSPKKMAQAVSSMLDVRMLFSCLVDADFLDTEAHFEGDAQGKYARPEGPKLDASAALAALDAHMAKLRNTTSAQTEVRQARQDLWSVAERAGKMQSGLFTLTAPTGSGKTLAMLKFALEHAARNNLKRVVLAVPFLSVIEQTAREYRKVFKSFPDNFVLEHHSLAGLGVEVERHDAEGASECQRRLLAENWDAPIVLTTNVQLLESLFSNRPSSCRKLHNLMESVILFDEAQSLPAGLVVPTLAALSHLSSAYRSSVVFATATQPAFDTLHAAVTKHAAQGWQPEEAVPGHAEMFRVLERVKVSWPKNGEKRSWAELAADLRSDSAKQVLCVVNLKRHVLALLDELTGTEGLFHLSTNMCAEHRRTVLNRVRKHLKYGKPCRLISTQCVEAGVDLDFPLVYRALAPLEAIAQAAGRCNREGKLNEQGRLGKVVVFEPNAEENLRRCYPTHAYYQAAEVTRTMLTLHGDLNINDPALFRDYYRRLYDLNNPANLNQVLNDAITALDFPEVAKHYRLIDQNSIQVLVPWADRWDEFDTLRSEAEREGISAKWMRRAQGLAVSIYQTIDEPPAWVIPAKLRRGGTSDEWFILEGDYYDDTLGLNPPKGEQVFIA
ncbi:CRISPR-associated helicase Cas3' [Candidatus Nitrotoga sp. AM1P]|uniref:CRISPR-associated helicase Cas3' n=1 Tax=Candidatus Nitrotoga sp. AM1P TaxID=2559597 RepID=UPI0010B24261|nr:CRISPR-associated helicase Cas3' [Candidatus Nitrotoga sp. AM1P]BBJ22383.1 CRISPR-associated helicase/endonuclease Cas3 [Candidatus Nitrotoga sp. AM1P]